MPTRSAHRSASADAHESPTAAPDLMPLTASVPDVPWRTAVEPGCQDEAVLPLGTFVVAQAAAAPDEDAAGDAAANLVQLRGRISHVEEPRVLPSGDTVVQLRLVVPRDRPTRRDASERKSPGVDTIDIACWTPATQRAVARIGVDGQAEVVGVLRRRFFRSGGGAASRYEVEARRVRRVPAPRTPNSATPRQTVGPTPSQSVATDPSEPPPGRSERPPDGVERHENGLSEGCSCLSIPSAVRP